jgi:predicted Zn-dependent peptidase
MMYKDQPQHLVQEILGELLWQDHALGRPLTGTTDTVGNISRAAILNFKTTKYVADNTIVVLAGKVDHAAAVKHIGELLGHVRGARKPAYPRVTKHTAQKDVHVFAKDIEQTHVALGLRLFGRHDSRRHALKLLSIILGENMSSRLFQVVREKHGLAYSIHSSVQLFDETGVLDIQAGVDSDRLSKAVDLILSEVVKFKNKLVGASELRRAKDYAIGQLRIGLESTSSQMMWAGENLMSYRRFIQPDEVIRKIEAVSENDVLRVAGEVLNGKNLSVAMIMPGGNDRHADLIRKKMRALD